MSMTIASLWPLSFLLVAVIDDLLYQKFHNWLFISLSLIGFLYIAFTGELSLVDGLLGFACGGLLFLPLVLFGAIGAGDMKFMASLGILLGPISIFSVFTYSLFWGAGIGLLKTLFAGKGLQLFQNFKLMAFKLKPTKLQKIPYTVAILFGWLTLKQLGGVL